MAENTFFFDQYIIVKRKQRRRKKPEDLPRSLRFASLNPRVAAYLTNHDRQRARKMVEGGEGGDGDRTLLGFGDDNNGSFLPNIHAENLLKLLRASYENVSFEGDVPQRQLYREARAGAGTMLVKLTKILYLFKTEHLDLQGELVNDLQSGYPELISDVRYDSYEWQCLENYPEEAEKAEEENTPGEEEGLPTFEVVDETEPTPEKKKKKKKKETHDALLPPAVDSKSVYSASISGLSSRRKSASSAVERQKSSIRSHSGREKRDSSLPRGKGSESSTPAIGDGLGGQGGIHQPSFVQIISFSMTNKSCEDKGWIVQAEEAQQEEQRSLLGLLLERLQETLRKVNEDAEVAKVKGHLHPFTNRYYGDAKREAMMKYLQTGRKQVSSRLLNIPTGRLLVPKVVHNTSNDSREKFMTSFPDGTCSVYYSSGRVAVMVTNASQGQPGHYTQLYDDDEKRTLLAVFTPTGRGSCYHPNGKISFCTTDKGCMVLDQDGKMTSKSSWPLPHCKLQLPVNIVLNDALSLRVLNLNQMTVTVSCQKETARIQVGQNMLAEEPQTQEQLGYIATENEFTSNAAKESIRPPPPPPKRKDKKNLKKSQSKYKIIVEEEPEVNPLAELLKRLEISEPGSYGIQAERELNKHMRKAKNTLEEWLEHYRLTLGITSPFLQRMPSAPPKRRRPTMSAKSTPGSLPPHRTTESEDAKSHVDVGGIKGHQRSPSVLAKALQRSLNCKSAPPGVLADEDEEGESTVLLGRVRIEVEGGEGRKKYSTSRTISRASRLTRSAVSNMSRKAPSTARTQETEASGDKSRKSSILTGCPVALREEMLGETIISCKCSRHRIPQVTDVELDKFLREIPRNQLVVLCVVSSLFRNAMPCTDMLLRLYERQNRNRTRLCYQSRFDSYRILLYDVVTAMEGTGNTHPELYLRHNAVPGMFLIYGATKLLFCDHIFNGYGNARKDFQKQLERCKHDARGRKFLPKDFRFSPLHGRRGPRSAWGGEIGGAASELPNLSNSSGVVRSSSASSVGTSRSASFSLKPWLSARPHTTIGKAISADSLAHVALSRLPQTAIPRIIT